MYVATLAPTVTFWDAGEFIAAAHTLGIPHPPGTPLYILLLRSWSLALSGLGTALGANLFSAVCTAASGALCATLLARVTGSRAIGIGAGLCAGLMSSVWLNATETEVYAASLLLSWLAIVAAERAGRTGERRWMVATAYLLGLAAPLHVSALVAAPAAVLLAATPSRSGSEWSGRALHSDVAAVLGGAFLVAAGIGTGSKMLLGAGIATLVVAAAFGVARPAATYWRIALPALGAALLAGSIVMVLLVRAAHDPPINQANPATLDALWDVLARRQYDVPGLWPRRAPLWLQLANMAQYADWQVALGVSPTPVFGPRMLARLVITLAYVALGVVGARMHRRADRRTFNAMLLLLGCATIGVAIYLNLRAGPSIGVGILPDDAGHEPRERDYFFALGFWTWGLWAGTGAVSIARRVAGRAGLGAALGLGAAALPVALNWSAVTRRSEPEARLPRVSALALLSTAPERAVLFVYGDNDTYPLWYLQQAEAVRRDVTVVTIPLLPARWYREELVRRDGLDAGLDGWQGLRRTLARLARSAGDSARPVVVAVGVTAGERSALGQGWRLTGVLYEAVPAMDEVQVDTVRAAALAQWLEEQGIGGARPREGTDATGHIVYDLLHCPRLAVEAERAPGSAAAALLDSTCNRR